MQLTHIVVRQFGTSGADGLIIPQANMVQGIDPVSFIVEKIDGLNMGDLLSSQSISEGTGYITPAPKKVSLNLRMIRSAGGYSALRDQIYATVYSSTTSMWLIELWNNETHVCDAVVRPLGIDMDVFADPSLLTLNTEMVYDRLFAPSLRDLGVSFTTSFSTSTPGTAPAYMRIVVEILTGNCTSLRLTRPNHNRFQLDQNASLTPLATIGDIITIENLNGLKSVMRRRGAVNIGLVANMPISNDTSSRVFPYVPPNGVSSAYTVAVVGGTCRINSVVVQDAYWGM